MSADDPSTIINVYPSLESIKKNSKTRSSLSSDYTDDEDFYDESFDGGDFLSEYSDDSNESECWNGDKKSLCASSSNVKPTWLPKNGQKNVKNAQKDVKNVAKVEAAKHHRESKAKVTGKGKYMKGEVEASPAPVESKSNSLTNLNINTASSSDKVKKLQDNMDAQWSNVHSWRDLQDMLQLLKKRKH